MYKVVASSRVYHFVILFSYRFLGPGMQLDQKIRDNVAPINKLDAAAKEHDIFYSQHPDIASRNEADKVLEYKAWDRVKDPNASVGEKVAGWITTNAMKVKRKLGKGICGRGRKTKGGRKKKQNKPKRGAGSGRGVSKHRNKNSRSLTFKQLVSKANSAIQRKKICGIDEAVEESMNALRGFQIKRGLPRIIPIAKRGNGLRLAPIVSVISYTGKIFDGIGSIIGGVKKIKEVRDEYKQSKLGGEVHVGNGLVFTQHKKGYGLRLQ